MKTVLITGASHGIGRAIASVFAEKGCRLFLNCRSSAAELQQLAAGLTEQSGVPCTPLICDVSDYEQVQKMFEEIEASGCRPDILINNAGISHIGLLQDMTFEEWNHVIQTNLSSAFSCSKFAIPHMLSQQSGKILNISSIWGNVGGSCEVAYSAAKGGLNAFTRALAKELAPSNIQVNAIACGVIDTRMNACFDSEERRALTEEIPTGRFGTPQEVAALAWDLCCGHPYLTGQIITLDGGFL